MFKVCLVDFEASRARSIAQGLIERGLRCRRARLWSDLPMEEMRTYMMEEVVYDWRTPSSVQDMIQGCNYIFFDMVSALCHDTLEDVVLRFRAICEGLRAGGGDRVIVMTSSALMRGDRVNVSGYGVAQGEDLLSKLIVMEMEMGRYMVDGIHMNALHLPVVVEAHAPMCGQVDGALPFNVMLWSQVIDMMASVVHMGRAGKRYLVGGVNTTGSHWHQFVGHSKKGATPAQSLALRGVGHHDVSLAKAHLGLDEVSSLGELFGSKPKAVGD